MSGVPSVIVTELAGNQVEAFDRAGQRIERAVKRTIARARARGRLGRLPPPAGRRDVGARGENVPRASASTAERNRNQRPRKATVALEGSTRSRSSRKST